MALTASIWWNLIWLSQPQSNGTQCGPHDLNLVELNTALTASICWNLIGPSRPQSDGTQYGPHGLNL
ncbi:hypothetical protein HAX54_051421, partial [Datura stramonium]|nr:hypothetical protein [Datura stramonium]